MTLWRFKNFSLALLTALILVFTTLSPAQATSIAPGSYDCNSGAIQTDPSKPTFTIDSAGVVSGGADCVGDVLIPDGATATAVWAFGTFTGSNRITTVSIPASLTSIGALFFYGVNSLTAIHVDPNNSAYASSTDGVLFNKNLTTLMIYPAGKSSTSYLVPDTVTALGDFSFTGAAALTSITVADRVTTLGSGSFARTSITSFQIPASVTSILSYTFQSTPLTAINIPAGVTRIWGNAFYDDNSLSTVTFGGNSAPTLDDGAFGGITTPPSASISLTTTGVGVGSGWSGLDVTRGDGSVACGGGGSFPVASNVVGYSSACSGAVEIPYGISAIGQSAFWTSAITSIVIPNTLKSIGDSALRNIPTLTSVVIPGSVETIGSLAFGTTPLTQVTFNSPSHLTTIGAYAFQSSEFTSIDIPASVTSIGVDAFQLNANLNAVNFSGTIPPGWTWASSVNVSGNVSCGANGYFVIQQNYVIGRHDCVGRVEIPTGVIGIGQEAFDADIYWGGGVGRIGGGNIGNSTRPTQITSLTIPNTVTTIGAWAFRNSFVSELVIPDSVTSMGHDAFINSTATSLTIGNGLTRVPESAFAGFTNLTTLTIGPGVRSIGDYAFAGASSLTLETLPDGVESIGVQAFSGLRRTFILNYCGNADLTGTGLPNPASNVADCPPGPPLELNAMPHDGSATIDFTPGHSGGAAITNYKYSYDGSTYTSLSPQDASSPVTIPGLTNGLPYTIYLKAVNAKGESFPSRPIWVTPRVPGQATVPTPGTYDCNTGLPTSSSPNYTITAGGVVQAGNYCEGAVVVANGATALGNWAFGGNSSIRSIYIPESVTSIGGYVFALDPSLKVINVANENQDYSSVDGVLFNKGGTTLIRYPQGKTKSSYTIPSGVTTLDFWAFNRATALASVSIPIGVTSIGDRAFQETSLTSVVIPEGVISLGDGVFENDESLITVSLPSTLTTFGAAVFSENYRLTTINIPSGITQIPYRAFYYDSSLASLSLPEGVHSIDTEAFESDGNLADVNFPSALQTIGVASFAGTALTSITLPSGLTSIADNAFQWVPVANISLPDSLRTIGAAAFYGGTHLTQITIPDGVETIGDIAFYHSGVTTVYYCGNASLAGTYLPSSAVNASSCRPAPPIGLSAIPGNGSVTLTFTPGLPGGSAILGYKYSLDGTNYTDFSPVVSSSPGVITGLTNGLTYTVYVKAVNSLDVGAPSTPITFSLNAPAYSSAVIAGVTAPEIGATPVTSVTAGTGYTGTVSWVDDSSNTPTIFEPGKTYTATITLAPDSGYTFDGVAANFFSVDGATSANVANSGVITSVFPTTANSAYSSAVIAGVTAPVFGATPVTSVTAGAGYTGTVSWSGSPSTFAAGTSYTATITLTPDAGYTFAGVNENFFTVAGATLVTNSAGSAVITALFPATEAGAPNPDMQLLAAPKITSETALSGAINLHWAAPSAFTGSSPVTGYQIEYSIDGLNYIVASNTVPASARSYTILGLAASSYYVRIAALSSQTHGAYGYYWTKLYSLSNPSRVNNDMVYDSGFGLAADGGQASNDLANTDFTRVRYELTFDSGSSFSYVDFNKFSEGHTGYGNHLSAGATVSNLVVPDNSHQFIVQTNVSDMNVFSSDSTLNSAGVTGHLEIWPYNYGTTVDGNYSFGNSNIYDSNDQPWDGGLGYGSFQVFNVTASDPVTDFAWNAQYSSVPDLGINNGDLIGCTIDYTFCGSPGGRQAGFSFAVLINAPLSIVSNPTSTSLTISSSTVSYGQSDTLTSSVTSGGQVLTAANGTMSFMDNGTTISGCGAVTLTSGVATCNFSSLSATSHSNITASYSGDASYSSSSSNAVSVDVSKATLNVVPDAAAVAYKGMVSYSNTYSGFVNGENESSPSFTQGLTASVCASNFSSNSTVASSPLVITCSGGGSTNYNFNTMATANLTIFKASPYVTSTVANASPIYGSTDDITASSSIPGVFAFYANGSLVSGCAAVSTVGGSSNSASCSWTPSGVSSYSLTATLTPDDGSNYESATTSPLTLTSSPAALTITPTVNQHKFFGEVDPTLTYSITSGVLVAGDQLTGSLTYTGAGQNTAAGDYAILLGTLNNSKYDLTLDSVNFSVLQNAQNAVSLSNLSTEFNPGNKTVVLTGNGGSGSGSFSYALNSGNTTAGCYVSGSTLSYESAGTCIIDVTRGSSPNFAAQVNTVTFTVRQASQSITFAPLASQTYSATPLNVTASASSGLDVVFSSGTPSVCVVGGVTGSSIHFLNVGTCAINANQPGDASNLAAAEVSHTFTVQPAPITITADAKSKAFGAADPAFTYQVTLGTVVAGDSLSGTPTRSSGTSAGTYAISAGTLTSANNPKYAVTFVPANLTITQIAPTLSLSYPNNNSGFMATGATISPTVLSASSGGSLSFSTNSSSSVCNVDSTSGVITEVGVGSCVVVMAASATTNYSEGSQSVTVTISPQSPSLAGISPGNLVPMGGTFFASPFFNQTISASIGPNGASVTIPANALPSTTAISVNLLTDATAELALIGGASSAALSVVVSWVSPDGLVPETATGIPISVTLTSPSIKAGAKIYSIIGSDSTLLGTASVDGSVTTVITSDPVLVVVNPAIVQAHHDQSPNIVAPTPDPAPTPIPVPTPVPNPVPTPKPVTPSSSASLVLGGFAPGSSILTPALMKSLQKLVSLVTKARKLILTGYTEGPTILATDAALSKSRAVSVGTYLRHVLKVKAAIAFIGKQSRQVGSELRSVRVSAIY